jgi:hypothetical protein
MLQGCSSCHVLQCVLFICKVKPVCELNVGDRLNLLTETHEHMRVQSRKPSVILSNKIKKISLYLNFFFPVALQPNFGPRTHPRNFPFHFGY